MIAKVPKVIGARKVHGVLADGIDMLADRIGRAREDMHFREIIPESFILGCSTPKEAGVDAEINGKVEIWFVRHSWTSGSQTIAMVRYPNTKSHDWLWPSLHWIQLKGLSPWIRICLLPLPWVLVPVQETQMLLASQQEVISNQVHRIQTLENSVKDLPLRTKSRMIRCVASIGLSTP